MRSASGKERTALPSFDAVPKIASQSPCDLMAVTAPATAVAMFDDRTESVRDKLAQASEFRLPQGLARAVEPGAPLRRVGTPSIIFYVVSNFVFAGIYRQSIGH